MVTLVLPFFLHRPRRSLCSLPDIHEDGDQSCFVNINKGISFLVCSIPRYFFPLRKQGGIYYSVLICTPSRGSHPFFPRKTEGWVSGKHQRQCSRDWLPWIDKQIPYNAFYLGPPPFYHMGLRTSPVPTSYRHTVHTHSRDFPVGGKTG